MTRFWRWWTQPAGRRFHVIPAYVLLAVAITVGIGEQHRQDAHYRREACLTGQDNDIAIRQALGYTSSTINRIILTFIGDPSHSTDPRARAVAESLADLNQKIGALTIRSCGEDGIIPSTNP